MQIRKIILGIMISLLPTGYLFAADIKVTAEVSPRQAVVGKQLRFVVIVEGKANIKANPELPDLSDFRVFGGSRSSNFSFVNGEVSSSLTFTYVLIPNKPGKQVIGPVKVHYKGQIYASPPVTVIIFNPNQNRPAQSQPAPQGQSVMPQSTAPQSINRRTQEPVFITTEVNKKRACVNEPIILKFKYFRRIPVLSQPQYTAPALSGFWKEDLPPQREYAVRVNGQEYFVTELRVILYPTTSGKLTIGPARLQVAIQGASRQSRDPFNSFFGSGLFSRGQQVSLTSEPISIQVDPVPVEGKPSDYSGTVGKWSMSAKLDRKQAKVGEALTLEVRIFGEGNVKSVGQPKLPDLPGFKVYETVSSSEVQKKEDTIRGVKIYRTLLRPQVTGKLSIPPIHFSYFNHGRKKYERISVPKMELNVLAGETQAENSGMTQTEEPAVDLGVKIISKDIRYLKTNLPLKPGQAVLPGWFWVLGFLVPPILLVLLRFWQQHQARLAADPRYARKIIADKSAQKALNQARHARKQKDAKLFYTVLAQAVSSYLADRMGVSRSGITQREMIQKLHSRGAGKSLTDELVKLFDETDFARFAPGQADPEAMAMLEKRAEDLLLRFKPILSKEAKQ
ncbi:BatD family protein [bacterium]|nr:BatD family protein [bacterium]